MAHHHGSDTPISPRAVLHHTDATLCTILHTTVFEISLDLAGGNSTAQMKASKGQTDTSGEFFH